MVQAWVMQTTRYKFCNSQRNSAKFLSGLKFELPTVVPSQLGVAKDAEEAPGEEEPQAQEGEDGVQCTLSHSSPAYRPSPRTLSQGPERKEKITDYLM